VAPNDDIVAYNEIMALNCNVVHTENVANKGTVKHNDNVALIQKGPMKNNALRHLL
jgi:hypothetical protein